MSNFTGSDIINRSMLDMEESRLYDVSAERGFLACLVKQPDLMQVAVEKVPRHAVHLEMHSYIYGIMWYVYNKVVLKGWDLSFDPISLATVAREMGREYEDRFYRRTESLEKVRELQRLSIHINVNQFPSFMATVLDRDRRVTAYREGRLLQERLLNLSANPEADRVILESEAKLARLAYNADDDAQITRLSDQGVETMLKAYVAHTQPDLNLFYIPVKEFPRWMHYLGGGFWRRNLTILAARPKTGKSTLLAQIAGSVSKTLQCPTLFMDNEMSREEIFSRELSLCSGAKEQDILAGRIYAETQSYDAVNAALETMKNTPMYYINIAGKPASFVASVMRQFRNQYVGYKTIKVGGQSLEVSNPSITVYDWMKMPSGTDMGKNKQAWEALGMLASTIKDTAKILDLAVVAGAQHNRTATKLSPKDWATQADNATGGSDEINKFCTARCDLRNVTPEEADAIGGHEPWKGCRPGREDRNALMYNQVMHVSLNRKGMDCLSGLPLHHDKGYFKYSEPHDTVVDGQGRSVDRVAEFMKSLARKGDNKTKGTVKGPMTAPLVPGGL